MSRSALEEEIKRLLPTVSLQVLAEVEKTLRRQQLTKAKPNAYLREGMAAKPTQAARPGQANLQRGRSAPNQGSGVSKSQPTGGAMSPRQATSPRPNQKAPLSSSPPRSVSRSPFPSSRAETGKGKGKGKGPPRIALACRSVDESLLGAITVETKPLEKQAPVSKSAGANDFKRGLSSSSQNSRAATSQPTSPSPPASPSSPMPSSSARSSVSPSPRPSTGKPPLLPASRTSSPSRNRKCLHCSGGLARTEEPPRADWKCDVCGKISQAGAEQHACRLGCDFHVCQTCCNAAGEDPRSSTRSLSSSGSVAKRRNAAVSISSE